MTIRPAVYPNPADVPALAPLVARGQDTDFVALLEESLQKAKEIAQNGDPGKGVGSLDAALFAALEPWPTTFDGYLGYLV